MNSFPFHSFSNSDWKTPEGAVTLTTIDAHTEGEPLRIFVEDFPQLTGHTILERRRYCREHYDHLRTATMWEPRGHADMYGCVITPAVTEDAHFGVLFLHNEGYSTMCGHGIIAVTTVALETGMLPMIGPETTVKIDTPAGLVTAHARIENHRVESVYFHNVPSFVLALDQTVDVPGLGSVSYDLAFGGAFYAYVNARDVGLSCTPGDFRALIEKAGAIKKAVSEQQPMVHPFEEDLNFLYGVIFIQKPLSPEAQSRNVCVFAEGEVDRCPTGTGVSARMAIHHARGEIKKGQSMVIESIIGSRFRAGVADTLTFGPHQAVIPEVEGRAYITGRHQFIIDPRDPLRKGFILR